MGPEDSLSPFQRILGADFGALPAPVQRIHSLWAPMRTAGRADVAAATGVMAKFLCWFAGLPKSGHDIPVSVVFTPDGRGGEKWDRKFGDRAYCSRLVPGTGYDAGFLTEHFGPFRLRFQLEARHDALIWTLTAWRLLGIPLPRWSVPVIDCWEGADGERFTFYIDVKFPLIGWVIRYHGWLMPEELR